jgi:regulator of protease activity HflC (stomatin/prohibitin superfamily)
MAQDDDDLPGGGGSGRRRRSTPFDHVDLGRFGGQHLAGAAWFLAVALLGLIAFLTSWYQVESEEVAVVQRFGAYVRTTEPGLHMKIPLFVESVTKVPVRRQLKMEFGFRTTRAGVQSQFAVPTSETRAE